MKPTNFNTPFGATYLPVENKNTADARFNLTFKTTTTKQQTSVEWLNEIISVHLTYEQFMQFEGLFKTAKEMNKGEIIDAYLVGADYATWADATAAKKYYNDKYNQNK